MLNLHIPLPTVSSLVHYASPMPSFIKLTTRKFTIIKSSHRFISVERIGLAANVS